MAKKSFGSSFARYVITSKTNGSDKETKEMIRKEQNDNGSRRCTRRSMIALGFVQLIDSISSMVVMTTVLLMSLMLVMVRFIITDSLEQSFHYHASSANRY